ncbi:hypothetical protein NDU88_007426 [Pleurodeles waltl]|uniref:Uncharacterized protein n=1 Tax=Pleurodeles waltl TaxID=8319 RepID=A0AAV7U000_PLEWA|nr:hypothetical protein NDU88_007426 [Pleurodeles waltl]
MAGLCSSNIPADASRRESPRSQAALRRWEWQLVPGVCLLCALGVFCVPLVCERLRSPFPSRGAGRVEPRDPDAEALHLRAGWRSSEMKNTKMRPGAPMLSEFKKKRADVPVSQIRTSNSEHCRTMPLELFNLATRGPVKVLGAEQTPPPGPAFL